MVGQLGELLGRDLAGRRQAVHPRPGDFHLHELPGEVGELGLGRVPDQRGCGEARTLVGEVDRDLVDLLVALAPFSCRRWARNTFALARDDGLLDLQVLGPARSRRSGAAPPVSPGAGRRRRQVLGGRRERRVGRLAVRAVAAEAVEVHVGGGYAGDGAPTAHGEGVLRRRAGVAQRAGERRVVEVAALIRGEKSPAIARFSSARADVGGFRRQEPQRVVEARPVSTGGASAASADVATRSEVRAASFMGGHHLAAPRAQARRPGLGRQAACCSSDGAHLQRRYEEEGQPHRDP